MPDADAPGRQPDKQPDKQPGPEGPARPPTGRDRLLAALRRPGRRQVVVAVLLALVGFAGITQIRANQVDEAYSGLRDQDLIDILDGLSGTTQRTQSRIEELRRTREDLLSESDNREAALRQAREEADSLDVLAGAVPVTGPGIRVTITAETGEPTVAALLDTIQELRTVGAEAMQVNGQVRVIAQTSFEDGPGGVLVDGDLLESPYVLDVIGPASALASAMEFPLGPRRQLEASGASVQVDELTSLDIDTVREPATPEFAEPDPGQ